MFPHPFLTHVLGSKLPTVKLLDVMEDVSNTNIYTFTDRSLGRMAGDATGDTWTYTTAPHLPTRSRQALVAFVHSEDAAVTWTLSTLSLGGVNGTIRIDRGGATSAINTAIVTWSAEALDGITTTDVVATFSEAITGCAIGFAELRGVGVFQMLGSTSQVGTGNLLSNVGGTPTNQAMRVVQFFASTCATGGSTELFTFENGQTVSRVSSMYAPVLLYEGSNAEFDYAAGYCLGSFCAGEATANHYGLTLAWSGAGAGDMVTATFLA
jgi:hypothetical protein